MKWLFCVLLSLTLANLANASDSGEAVNRKAKTVTFKTEKMDLGIKWPKGTVHEYYSDFEQSWTVPVPMVLFKRQWPKNSKFTRLSEQIFLVASSGTFEIDQIKFKGKLSWNVFNGVVDMVSGKISLKNAPEISGTGILKITPGFYKKNHFSTAQKTLVSGIQFSPQSTIRLDDSGRFDSIVLGQGHWIRSEHFKKYTILKYKDGKFFEPNAGPNNPRFNKNHPLNKASFAKVKISPLIVDKIVEVDPFSIRFTLKFDLDLPYGSFKKGSVFRLMNFGVLRAVRTVTPIKVAGHQWEAGTELIFDGGQLFAAGITLKEDRIIEGVMWPKGTKLTFEPTQRLKEVRAIATESPVKFKNFLLKEMDYSFDFKSPEYYHLADGAQVEDTYWLSGTKLFFNAGTLNKALVRPGQKIGDTEFIKPALVELDWDHKIRKISYEGDPEFYWRDY